MAGEGLGWLLDLPNRSSRGVLLVRRTVILQIPLKREIMSGSALLLICHNYGIKKGADAKLLCHGKVTPLNTQDSLCG